MYHCVCRRGFLEKWPFKRGLEPGCHTDHRAHSALQVVTLLWVPTVSATSPLAQASGAFLRGTVDPRPLWRALSVGPSGHDRHLKMAPVWAFRGNRPASYNHPGEARGGGKEKYSQRSFLVSASVTVQGRRESSWFSTYHRLQTQSSAPMAMWGVPSILKGTKGACVVPRELEEVHQESVQRSRYVVKGGKMDPVVNADTQSQKKRVSVPRERMTRLKERQ